MHKNATKCNKTLSKWCKNKHGASKIIDTFETYQASMGFMYDYGSLDVSSSNNTTPLVATTIAMETLPILVSTTCFSYVNVF
jgi:hypothetical protein